MTQATESPWLEFPEYPGYRFRIRGQEVDCESQWKCGMGGRGTEWRRRKVTVRPDGRKQFTVKTAGRAVSLHFCHIVLRAFVGPCPPGMEACHLDDDPRNNDISNLRWDTHESNMRNRMRNGKHALGIKTNIAKLDEDKVREIRGLLRQGLTHAGIAGRYQVCGTTVHNIAAGKCWRWVPDVKPTEET